MIVHKLIERIQRPPAYWMYFDEGIIDRINRSVHFDLGGVKSITEAASTNGSRGAKLFKGNLGGILRTPYPHCCFRVVQEVDNVHIFLITEEFREMDAMECRCYVFHPGRDIVGLAAQFVVEGLRSINDEDVEIYINDKVFRSLCVEGRCSEGEAGENTNNVMQLLNLTLLFMNAKNIGSERHDPPQVLNKKRIKRGKQPLFSFYTLKIFPMVAGRKGITSANDPTHSNRVHLCRGHFRVYTKDAPLFGKFAGRFWVPAHARGKKQLGMIAKDYEVAEDG